MISPDAQDKPLTYRLLLFPFNELRTGAEMSQGAYQRSNNLLVVESGCESKRELEPPP